VQSPFIITQEKVESLSVGRKHLSKPSKGKHRVSKRRERPGTDVLTVEKLQMDILGLRAQSRRVARAGPDGLRTGPIQERCESTTRSAI
jgi:hypothetical protein